MLKIFSSFNKSIFQYSIKNNFSFSTNVQQVPRQYMEPVQTKFQIIDKQKINHDCYIYRFHFDGPKFPLEIGHHFRIKANIPTVDFPKGEDIMKYYTPITSLKDFLNNKIQVLIKIYRPFQNPTYPKGGQLTPYLQKLNVGDKIDVEGPFGKFTYVSPGKIQICQNLFSKTKKVYNVKKLFFIAGGTGVTPIYQTISEIARIPEDKTEMTLLFCNKTQNDIILRKQLEALKPRLDLKLMLETAPEGWNQYAGRPDEEVMKKIHPLNDPDTFYLYCGPKPMNMALNKIFAQNYPKSFHHKI